MPLSPKEEEEYFVLLRDCGSILCYPQMYEYNPKDDTYSDIKDKHEWHHGKDIRRMHELCDKKDLI